MSPLTRRNLLRAATLVAGGATVGACSGGGTGSTGKQSDGLRFWTHNGEMRFLFEEIFAEFEKKPGGVPVTMHYEPPKTIGRSTQLAWQSGQMPDIHTLAGLELPASALYEQGWFQPVDLGSAAQRLPTGSLIDGIHRFDGKTYSFPIISFRQYWAPVWFLSGTLEKHGLDPANPPRTYDEFRAAGRQVKKASGGNVFGWMSKLGAVNHMAPEIEEIAQAAGFTGSDGVDFETGEYAYHSEPFVAAVEFMLSLHRDGLMVPGSVTQAGADGQLRWAAGEAAFWIDGPWLPGFIEREVPELADQLGVTPVLVPEAGRPVTTYRGPQGGNFWISSKSDRADKASLLLRRHFTTEEFFAGIASSSAVPADLTAVAEADVPPAYRQLIQWYRDQVFLAPSAVARNPDVATVMAETRPVQPDYPDTLHGLFTGDLPDARRALKQLSDRLSAERDRALAKARKKGAKVEEDAWAFPDWQPRTDYTTGRRKGD